MSGVSAAETGLWTTETCFKCDSLDARWFHRCTSCGGKTALCKLCSCAWQCPARCPSARMEVLSNSDFESATEVTSASWSRASHGSACTSAASALGAGVYTGSLPAESTGDGARRGRGRVDQPRQGVGAHHEQCPKHLVRLSRSMSQLLRHGALEEGLHLSPDGFASMVEVIEVLSSRRSWPRDGNAAIREVVAKSLHNGQQPRFEIVLDPVGIEMIRAFPRPAPLMDAAAHALALAQRANEAKESKSPSPQRLDALPVDARVEVLEGNWLSRVAEVCSVDKAPVAEDSSTNCSVVIGTCQRAFDAQAFGHNYLSLNEGERVYKFECGCEHHTDTAGWAYGRKSDKREGWFPPTFVQPISESRVELTVDEHITDCTSSQPSVGPPPSEVASLARTTPLRSPHDVDADLKAKIAEWVPQMDLVVENARIGTHAAKKVLEWIEQNEAAELSELSQYVDDVAAFASMKELPKQRFRKALEEAVTAQAMR